MIWLFLSIFSSTLLLIIFRAFQHFKIDNLQAIIMNYVVAGTLGCVLNESNTEFTIANVWKSDWLLWSVGLGCLFIGVFYLMAVSAQQAGIGVTSVATKMSVILPILAGILLYHEKLSGIQWFGILLAFPAIVLSTGMGGAEKNKKWFLPLVIFLCSGLIDTLVGYSERKIVQAEEFALFSAFIFITAACIGLLIFLTKRKSPSFKNLVGGIILGIPNYFSIYFLILGLHECDLDSARYFSLNNMGIVLLSSTIGIIFLRETSGWLRTIGIMLSLLSIYLISV